MSVYPRERSIEHARACDEWFVASERLVEFVRSLGRVAA